MFTGIIKEVGRVIKIIKKGSLITLGIQVASQESFFVSDSVCVNGVCLTVTKKEKDVLFFDAILSTLAKTNLKRLKIGDMVNLEPALNVHDKLGGHFVLGHVDSEAKLKRITKQAGSWRIVVELAPQFKAYIVENGSIAIEGISLTVKKVLPREFTADIIPFTYEHTTLKYKHPGAWLNIEFDYLLKKTENNK
ncbi:MAG: riboflavin synthase [Candidatus Omnitrophota bacterium]